MQVNCSLLAGTLALLISTIPAQASPYPGVPTRSQNPLLQSYFIPAMPLTGEAGWSHSHALYITNTYQQGSSATETLLIDVENTRYDFQATLTQQLWHFNINLSLISNASGFLDQTIVNWHDFFGLPQGGRDDAINNQTNLFYQQQGTTFIDRQRGGSGVADVQLAIGYQLSDQDQLWLGIELPSGDSDPLISNDAIDLAAWYAWQRELSSQLDIYGLAGMALPGDDGVFAGQLERQFLFAQLGLFYRYHRNWQFFLQSDLHSRIVKQAQVDALNQSLQAQFGLRLPRLFDSYQLDLFFSEDIAPGHAPDISFSLRLYPVVQ